MITMNYELLNANNEVVNTIVLNDLSAWQIPEGHTLRLLSEPESSPKPPLTQLMFLRLFTAQERIAIKAAANTDPIVEDFLYLLNLAQDINLQDVDTVAGVNYLEQQGLIAPNRAQEILT